MASAGNDSVKHAAHYVSHFRKPGYIPFSAFVFCPFVFCFWWSPKLAVEFHHLCGVEDLSFAQGE